MKKLLIGIFTFLIGFISFSSAESYYGNSFSCYIGTPINGYNECSDDVLNFGIDGNDVISGDYIYQVSTTNGLSFEYDLVFWPYIGGVSSSFKLTSPVDLFFSCSSTYPCREINPYNYYGVSGEGLVTFTIIPYGGVGGDGGSSSSEINVYYNNGSSTSILCDGENSIAINGLSTLYGTSTFVPFFNISYVDEDNQNLIESYDKEILYLSGGQYHKTYTGDNQWILNLVGGSSNTGGFNIISSGLVVSGDIVSSNLSGNIFKNFIDTGFEVLFSNIPSYIQYVILIVILIIILRAFTKKRKKF